MRSQAAMFVQSSWMWRHSLSPDLFEWRSCFLRCFHYRSCLSALQHTLQCSHSNLPLVSKPPTSTLILCLANTSWPGSVALAWKHRAGEIILLQARVSGEWRGVWATHGASSGPWDGLIHVLTKHGRFSYSQQHKATQHRPFLQHGPGD